MYRDYGPICKESIGNTFTIVHLFDPVDIETVYRSDDKIPQRHAFHMLEMYNKRAKHVQGLLTRLVSHYYNTPLQYTACFQGFEDDNFQMKNCDIFLNFAQNIDRGYSLEAPHLGGSNVYP